MKYLNLVVRRLEISEKYMSFCWCPRQINEHCFSSWKFLKANSIIIHFSELSFGIPRSTKRNSLPDYERNRNRPMLIQPILTLLNEKLLSHLRGIMTMKINKMEILLFKFIRKTQFSFSQLNFWVIMWKTIGEE